MMLDYPSNIDAYSNIITEGSTRAGLEIFEIG